MTPPRPAVAELQVADEPAVWEALGFVLQDGVARVGGVGIRPLGPAAGTGIVGWILRDAGTTPAGDTLDGLPTIFTDTPPVPAGTHPNGAVSVDHVVVLTPDRERTSRVLDAAGLGLRRVRSDAGTPERPLHQAFHRAGEVIVEVVGAATSAEDVAADDGPATFWGLVCVTPDLEATARLLGDRLGSIRDAVQPGRRIATARRTAGSSVPLAFINLQS